MVTTPSRPCRPRRLPKPPTNCTFFFCFFWVEQQHQVLITDPGGPDDDLELWNAHNSLLFTACPSRQECPRFGLATDTPLSGRKIESKFSTCPQTHTREGKTRTQLITPHDSN
uniref:(northern house mosquito) hypothetical protein n=1 Tax=Culex pipiens TaxID=7175 RepID=A0A8D8F4W3_CULPI